MYSTIKRKIWRNVQHWPGFHTKRKLLVFESDDWGTIKMRSKADLDFFREKGAKVDDCPYLQNDALESNEDLEQLFEVLLSFKDSNGNHPIITANTVMGNPDFEKIKGAGFQTYFYECFTKTLLKYSNTDKLLNYYKQGQDAGIYLPQFHGREHVNFSRWLRFLKDDLPFVRDAFDREIFSIYPYIPRQLKRLDVMDAFGFDSMDEKSNVRNSIIEGYDKFTDVFGFRSRSVIAPCYHWHTDFEHDFYELGIEYIQGSYFQSFPVFINGEKSKKSIFRYTGKKNKFGQINLVRNVSFEPTMVGNYKIENTLKQIEQAFYWRKPAIISTHRLNFIGRINPVNREENLNYLRILLINVLKKWPDIEFISSVRLGELMSKKV